MVRLMIRVASFVGVALVVACLAAIAPAAAGTGIVPVVSVTGSPNPATTGAVLYSVTVTDPTNAGTPTGIVTVSDGATGSCTTLALDGTGSGSCSIEEPAGTYGITATYPGDSNYSSATGTTSETVDQASPTVTVSPQAGATTGLVSYGVNVAGPAGAVIPTGDVIVTDGTTTGQCTTPTLDGTGSASCSIEEGAGTYSLTATYSSDSNYEGATGTGTETVGLGLPTVTVTPQAGAHTGLVSYAVAVVGPSGAVIPTGDVIVTDGTTSGQCTAPLNSGGSGSCSIAEGAGSYSVTGTYSGDLNYSSATGTAEETVAQATATMKGSGQTGAVAGDVTYSVSVTGSTGGPVPTGTVQVSVLYDGENAPTCPITLSNGAGSCQLFQAAGKYTIKFTYSGDVNYLAPAAPPISETVGDDNVSVAVAASANPATAKLNGKAKVTYTVTVTGASGLPDPTGSVVVADETGASCSIASLTSGAGECSFNEVVGTHTVTATTSGDGFYNVGTEQVTEYVGTNTTTTYSKTGNPVAPGGTVTLKAKIKSTAVSAGAPNGAVVFMINGVAQSPATLTDGVATLPYTVPDGTSPGKAIVEVEYQSSDTNTWFDSSTSGGFMVS